MRHSDKISLFDNSTDLVVSLLVTANDKSQQITVFRCVWLSCYMREACTALDLSSQAVPQASSFRQQVFSVQNDVKNAWQPKNGFLVSVDSHAHVATCDCASETLFPTH